ncbi:MAG: hypothetical protein ABH832_03690 [bacterium]
MQNTFCGRGYIFGLLAIFVGLPGLAGIFVVIKLFLQAQEVEKTAFNTLIILSMVAIILAIIFLAKRELMFDEGAVRYRSLLSDKIIYWPNVEQVRAQDNSAEGSMYIKIRDNEKQRITISTTFFSFKDFVKIVKNVDQNITKHNLILDDKGGFFEKIKTMDDKAIENFKKKMKICCLN